MPDIDREDQPVYEIRYHDHTGRLQSVQLVTRDRALELLARASYDAEDMLSRMESETGRQRLPIGWGMELEVRSADPEGGS